MTLPPSPLIGRDNARAGFTPSQLIAWDVSGKIYYCTHFGRDTLQQPASNANTLKLRTSSVEEVDISAYRNVPEKEHESDIAASQTGMGDY